MTMQGLYALLYLEINIVSVILVGLIRYKTRGISRMTEQRNFAMSIDTEIVFFLSDTFYVMMKCGVLPYNSAAVIAAKSIYFLTTAMMCYFWFVYFELMQESRFIRRPRSMLYSSGLVILMALLLIINLFTGILFYVDESGVYHRGSAFAVQYVISYIYVIFTCTRAFLGLFVKENYSRRKMLVLLALFPVIPAGAGILQYIYPELPAACAAMSIATLIMYLNWTDQMISVDPLTNLSNRKRLTHYYEQWAGNVENTVPMYLMVIDVNSFKKINDTYGHIRGDEALVRIASSLELACGGMKNVKTVISRYGGDEFIILLNTADADSCGILAEKIPAVLKELNDRSGAPYELTVSIGTAEADKSLPMKDIIEEADKLMYIEKEKHHSRS